ncbi:Oxidoreductase aprR [Exophiala dermatitidis]
MSALPLKRILIIGASGNLGSLILHHLASSPNGFSIIVLSRTSSTAQFPANIQIRRVSDDYPVSELNEAFRGVDAVISSISMAGMHHQYKFIDAAIAAGVRRYFPTEFGLDDLPDWLIELRPMFRIKHDVRDYLVAKQTAETTESSNELSKESAASSSSAAAAAAALEYTLIVCNVFFEMGVLSGFFGLDWSTKTATLIDGGTAKWVATTLDTVAIAVVRALERPEQTKNKLLLVQDFRTSQREILDGVEKRTATKWKVRNVEYGPWLEEAKELVRKGEDLERALPMLTFATVVTGSEWEGKREEFANGLLDLKTKSFDEALDGALRGVV